MPEKIQIAQINHVTTMVKDTGRAMKFYNDLLGIKVESYSRKISLPIDCVNK